MNTKIQKWGNSIGVRIPSYIVHKLNLTAGSNVEITLNNDHIEICPKKLSLQQLVDQVHEIPSAEWEEDISVGKEEW